MECGVRVPFSIGQEQRIKNQSQQPGPAADSPTDQSMLRPRALLPPCSPMYVFVFFFVCVGTYVHACVCVESGQKHFNKTPSISTSSRFCSILFPYASPYILLSIPLSLHPPLSLAHHQRQLERWVSPFLSVYPGAQTHTLSHTVSL